MTPNRDIYRKVKNVLDYAVTLSTLCRDISVSSPDALDDDIVRSIISNNLGPNVYEKIKSEYHKLIHYEPKINTQGDANV